MMKNLLFILFTFLFIGCTSKQLTVKSLQPSLVSKNKINYVILEDFENDRINQTDYLEEKLVNMTIENQRVFQIQTSYKNIDAIITGEVLQSHVHTNFYYDEDIDYNRCWQYQYKDGKRTNKCLKYLKRKIPCEKKEYIVKTRVKVLNKNENLLFSKIYTKTKNTNQCYKNRFYYDSYFFKPRFSTRNEYRVNSDLAKLIAQDVIKNISPHYIYENIPIIEELDKKYNDKIKNEFENIVELLDNKNINIAQSKLHKLNNKLEFKSYEVLYNLALSYEAKDQLKRAQDYYIEAKNICENIDDLKFIDTAINRTQMNLVNKIKAKSQLP